MRAKRTKITLLMARTQRLFIHNLMNLFHNFLTTQPSVLMSAFNDIRPTD